MDRVEVVEIYEKVSKPDAACSVLPANFCNVVYQLSNMSDYVLHINR